MSSPFATEADLEAYLAKAKRGFKEPFHIDTEETPDEGPESRLQIKAQNWMDDHGFPWLHDRSRGKNKPGQFLDLYCFLKDGRVEIFEFKKNKRENRADRKKQRETIQRLLFLKHRVHVVTSYKRFLEIVSMDTAKN